MFNNEKIVNIFSLTSLFSFRKNNEDKNNLKKTTNVIKIQKNKKQKLENFSKNDKHALLYLTRVFPICAIMFKNYVYIYNECCKKLCTRSALVFFNHEIKL